MRSNAWPAPTIRGSVWLTPMSQPPSPSLMNSVQNRAVCDAMRMTDALAKANPPP